MGTKDFFESDLGKKKDGDIPLRGDSPLLESLEPRLMMSGDPVLNSNRATDFSNFFQSVDMTPIWDTADKNATVSLLGITDGIDITNVEAPSFDQLTTIIEGVDASINTNHSNNGVDLHEFMLHGLKSVLKNQLTGATTLDSLKSKLSTFTSSKLGTETDGDKILNDYVQYDVIGKGLAGAIVENTHSELGTEINFNFNTEFHKGLKIDLGDKGKEIGLSLGSITIDVNTIASLDCTIGLLDSSDINTAYIRFNDLGLSTSGAVDSLGGKSVNLGFLGLEIEDSGSNISASASIGADMSLLDISFPIELGFTQSDMSKSGSSITSETAFDTVVNNRNEFTLNLGGKKTKNIKVSASTAGADTIAKVQNALNSAGFGSVVTASASGAQLNLKALTGNFSALGIGSAKAYTSGNTFTTKVFTSTPSQSFNFTVYENGAFKKFLLLRPMTYRPLQRMSTTHLVHMA